MPTVFSVEPNSRRIVATAAMQGVYSSVKTRKLAAERLVNIVESGAPPNKTSSVLTTDSFAMKPEIREVAQRQSAKPSGANTGAIHRPMRAKRLSALSATTFSLISKLCRNQMMIVARKITVKALCKKSLAFSHSRSATLLRLGKR